MLSHRTKIYSMIKKTMHVHVQYLGVLHDGVNMSVTTVHMALSKIWMVLNLGWVHSRPPSFILATLPLYVLVKDQARRLNEVGP